MDARVRGNAHQLLEKYRNMARDATLAGDRITAEYYLQYADHYYRVLNDSRPRFEENRPQPRDDWRERDERDERDDEADEDGATPGAEPAYAEAARAEPRARPDPRERAERPGPAGRVDAGRGLRPASARSAAGEALADDPLDGDGAPDMIALSALPPAISRPLAAAPAAQPAPSHDGEPLAAGAPVLAGPDAAPGDAAGVDVGAAEAEAPPPPRRRGRPPKRKPESATAEFEEA